ncbi:T9SS type A sorting domain-containing protein [Ferruginibacter sp.]
MKSIFLRLFFLFVLLFILVCISATHVFSQCLTAPTASCNSSGPLVTANETLNSGTTKWYYGSAATFNSLTLNGGTLIICGNLTIDKFYMDSGKIFVQPGARFVIGSGIGYGLGLKGNSYLYNYGTLEILRNLSFENGWATAAKPNVLINATTNAVLKMNNQYFVINNAYSWFVNKGRAYFHGIITDPQASPRSVCMGKSSETVMTVLYNKVKNSYYAPDPYACLSVSEFSQLWDTLSNANPFIHVCLGLTHKLDSTCIPYGCKPSWGLADIFRRCGGCAAIQILSNNFISFYQEQKGNGNMLYWEIQNSIASATYTIEVSVDGKNFSALYPPLPANADGSPHYSQQVDAAFTGTSYYRIKYLDTVAGFSTYSAIIKVRNQLPAGVLVYPNPFADHIFISLPGNYSAADINIADMYGRILVRSHFSQQAGRWQLNLPAQLPPGVYRIIIAAGKERWVQKIIKANR